MYRRLLLGSVSSSGCRKLHMSAAVTRAAATATARSPNETPETNEHADANEPGERTHDYIDITNTQRLILGIGSSLAALVNPRRFVSVWCWASKKNPIALTGALLTNATSHTQNLCIYSAILYMQNRSL